MIDTQVDGRVTQLWKFFFRPGVGTTDRLGVAIPFGDVLDQVQLGGGIPALHVDAQALDVSLHLTGRSIDAISAALQPLDSTLGAQQCLA